MRIFHEVLAFVERSGRILRVVDGMEIRVDFG